MALRLYLIEDQPLAVCFQMVLEFVIFLIAALLWLTWCTEHLITSNSSEAKSLAFALPSYLLGQICLMTTRFVGSRLKDKFCFSFYLASGVRFMCSAAILFPEFSREWYSVAYGFISLLCFVNTIFHIALQTNPETRPVRRMIAPDGTLNENPPTEMMTLTQLEHYRDIIRDYMETHAMPEKKAASARSTQVIKVSLQGLADGYQSDRSRPRSAGLASMANRRGTLARNLKYLPTSALADYPGNRNRASKPIFDISPIPSRSSPPTPKKHADMNVQFGSSPQIVELQSLNLSSRNLAVEDSLSTIPGTVRLSDITIESQTPSTQSHGAQITALETNKFQRQPFLQQASDITNNAELRSGSNHSESWIHDIVSPCPLQTRKSDETGRLSRHAVQTSANNLKHSQALPNPSSVGKIYAPNRDNRSTSNVVPNRRADGYEHIVQETSFTPCKHLAANGSAEAKLESNQHQRLAMHQPTNSTTHTPGDIPQEPSNYSEGWIHDTVKICSQQTRCKAVLAHTPESRDCNYSGPGTSMAGTFKENFKELRTLPTLSPESCPRSKNATGDAHMNTREYKIPSKVAHNRNPLGSNQLQRCPHRKPNRPEPHDAEPIHRYRSNSMLDIMQPSATTTPTVAQPMPRHLPTCPMHNSNKAKPEPVIAIKSAPNTPATEQGRSHNPELAPR